MIKDQTRPVSVHFVSIERSSSFFFCITSSLLVMGKFRFPSCCCSRSCFSPSSPSTLSPSSQPSQQPANVGPPATTTTYLESFLHKFKDISQIEDLILDIEELLKIASGEKNEEGSTSAADSYIQDGQTILEFVDKHNGRLPAKKDSIDSASAETEKVLIEDLLHTAGKIHWVGAALSVVGFVLARFNQMSNNKSECLPSNTENYGKSWEANCGDERANAGAEEAVECIITSQLAKTQIFKFLTASVNADSLKPSQLKIDRLYKDLQL